MKYLILGAGPSGLTVGVRLKQLGIDDFLIIEKEAVAGGLCRSVDVDGAAFDIGGGHFLDVRRPKVNEFLFGFMPEDEWNLFNRDSRIVVNGNEIGHPIESNIWQMKISDQVEYIKSIAQAGCNMGEPMPKEFIKWIYWKLGDKIANDYMIPYNQKMFNNELDELGTYWLEKLPNVSFDQTLYSCLEHKPYGTQPGHAQFYYPKKFGYGELWLRMAEFISGHIIYGRSVTAIDFNNKEIIVSTGEKYKSEVIISSIPWTSIDMLEGLPDKLNEDVKKLKHSSIETRYYNEKMDTDSHWIYYPDPILAYHRILVRSNFCTNAKGYWTETNSQRVDLIPDEDKARFHYMNEYAYPLNTIEKPRIMKELLTWTESKKVFGLGRWGEWQHYNSDVTVERALELVEQIV